MDKSKNNLSLFVLTIALWLSRDLLQPIINRIDYRENLSR